MSRDSYDEGVLDGGITEGSDQVSRTIMFKDDYITLCRARISAFSGQVSGENRMLSERERERYLRQLPLFGDEGQEILRSSSVCVAGAGGLGSPVALYLAAAGVGHIRLLDPDRVDRSNLNRQILHTDPDIPRFKVDSAAEKLVRLNPDIRIEPMPIAIHEGNALLVADGMDLLVDALDSYPPRYLLNRVAFEKGIPLIHAAVSGFVGQLTTIIPGETPCLRCAIPHSPEGGSSPPVLGATAGILGTMEALEAIKVLLGMGDVAKNFLLVWDGMYGRLDQIPVERIPGCPVCGSRG